MTLDEIDNAVALMRAAGRTTIPMPLSEWREAMAARLPKASLTKTKTGKTMVKMPDRASVSRKIGRKKKADRLEKGLRANREKVAAKRVPKRGRAA